MVSVKRGGRPCRHRQQPPGHTLLWLRFIYHCRDSDVGRPGPCSACVLGGAPVLTWCPHHRAAGLNTGVLGPASAEPEGTRGGLEGSLQLRKPRSQVQAPSFTEQMAETHRGRCERQ